MTWCTGRNMPRAKPHECAVLTVNTPNYIDNKACEPALKRTRTAHIKSRKRLPTQKKGKMITLVSSAHNRQARRQRKHEPHGTPGPVWYSTGWNLLQAKPHDMNTPNYGDTRACEPALKRKEYYTHQKHMPEGQRLQCRRKGKGMHW